MNSAHLLPQVIDLDKNFFPFPWNAEQWRQVIAEQDRYSLYCEESEEVLKGFVLYDHSQAEQQAHLLKIIVHPSYRNGGLAREMLYKSIQGLMIREVYLEVAVDNKPAIGLYTSLGFEILCEKKKFYSSGQSAFAMLLKI